MATVNKITATRNRINRSVKELADQLNFQTGTLECDLGKKCSVFVDVEYHDDDGYAEMEAVDIEMAKDGVDSNNPYPNIADYIGKQLDIVIAKMNAEEYQSVQNWDYQREYESIGGMFAY